MINGATPTHLDDGLEMSEFICHNKLKLTIKSDELEIHQYYSDQNIHN
jgi:hypothetical protein